MTRNVSVLRPVLCAALVLATVGVSSAQNGNAGTTPLYEGMGSAHIPITTDSELAQQYFDQGLRLVYGFWMSEARRSFDEAIRHDPNAPMVYWGKALAHAPYINYGVPTEQDLSISHEAVQKALELKDSATPLERDLIDAMATFFGSDTSASRDPFDRAYAAAMKDVAVRHPDNVEVLTLAAAAHMNTTRWNYWTKDGKPLDGTLWLVDTLEHAMELDPRHAGAIHHYVHGVEASDDVYRAREPARILASTAPNIGHLVHMGSHILIQTGDFDLAGDTNIDASVVDELYIGKPDQEGVYPVGSYQHNVHFAWVAGGFEGRSAITLQSAHKLGDEILESMPPQLIASSIRLQNYLSSPLYAMARFGHWDQILSEAPPPEDFRFATGMYRYARGLALAHTGRLSEGWQEHAALLTISESEPVDGTIFSAGPQPERRSSPYVRDRTNLLLLAANAMAGEMKALERKWDDAIAYLETAVELQDNLAYAEPPPWYYPVRQSLGAVLLDAGRAEQAALVYQDDLEQWPENGWSLYGLMKSLRAQGDTREARLVEKRFLKAWTRADIALTGSRF